MDERLTGCITPEIETIENKSVQSATLRLLEGRGTRPAETLLANWVVTPAAP